MMFGAGASVAVQDPSYPVYVDSSVIMGMTQGFEQLHGGYGNIHYMLCRPDTDFFPDLGSVRSAPFRFSTGYEWHAQGTTGSASCLQCRLQLSACMV